jgi:hypothetical protein
MDSAEEVHNSGAIPRYLSQKVYKNENAVVVFTLVDH